MPEILNISWLQLMLIAVISTQLTILCVTIYLHRAQAHRALDVNKYLAHFMRFWLWLTTGTSTKEWVAVHRKHHAKCETVDDPHSPQIKGILTVLFKGWSLYRQEAKKEETILRYGIGSPNDWIENNFYRKHSFWGVMLFALLAVILFGPLKGGILALIQFLWIPFWAAGIINGFGHFKGYRNFNSNDKSKNLVPFGIWIGGEELHNNHHAFPTSAKLSYFWWEVDIGWGIIKLLNFFNLVKIKNKLKKPKLSIDLQSSELLPLLFKQRLIVEKWFEKVWINSIERLAKTENWSKAEILELKESFNSSAIKHSMTFESKKTLNEIQDKWNNLKQIWNINTSERELVKKLDAWFLEAEQIKDEILKSMCFNIKRLT